MQIRILLGAKCDLWSCVHALDGENMIFGGINVSEAAPKNRSFVAKKGPFAQDYKSRTLECFSQRVLGYKKLA